MERGTINKLDELKTKIRKWYSLEDEEALEIILAVAIEHDMIGDPLWIFLIGPPSSGRTELVRALRGCQYCYSISNLTHHTFVSGLARGNYIDIDLLPKIDKKCVVIKDLSTLLSRADGERRAIFGQLRDIYDGSYSPHFARARARQRKHKETIRVNFFLTGEPARWLLDWKRRGLVKSNRDAVVQAFRVMHEKILQQDMEEVRLRTLRDYIEGA